MNNILNWISVRVKCFFFFLISFLCLQTKIQAQNFRVTHYMRDAGLQNELVKAITIDTLGIVWLATDEGLISYNGLVFNQFKEQLPSNYVKSIYKTRSGTLLCATDLGLVQVLSSPNSADFKLIKTGSTKSSDTTLWYPKHFFEDSRKTIWFSDNNSIWRMRNDEIKKYPQPEENLTMSWQRSFSFAEDGNGNLYAFSHPGNLFVYNPNKDHFEAIALLKKPGFISHCINLSKGNILVATANGVFMYVFDEKANLLEIKTIQTNIDAAYLEKKNENEVWVGTWKNGLYLIKNINTQPEIIKIENYESNIASFLYQNSNGDLWVAGDNGFALVQTNYCDALYQNQSKTYTQNIFQKSGQELYFTDGENIFFVNPQNPHLPAKKLISKTGKYFLALTEVNGQLWAADNIGIISIIEKGEIVNSLNLSKNGGAIFYMINDNNNVWLCQDKVAGVVKIDKNLNIRNYAKREGITSAAVSLTLSPENVLYAGCQNNGNFLFKYDSKEDKFINLSQDFDFKQPREINIHQMCFHQSTLWMGTSYGLVKFENKQFTPIEYGMPNEAVKAITTDQEGNVWFAVSTGIVKLENNEIFTFNETCGLPSKTVSFRGMITDSYNQIWVGTTAGIGLFTNKIPALKTPKPYFIYIQNDEKIIQPNQNTFLSTSLFKFKFIASSYPSKYTQYRWRLKGKNEDWQKLESLDGLFLSNLSSGSYIMEIACRQNNHFIWSDSLTFNFDTHAAWHKTWAAFLGYLLLGFGLVYFIVKSYTRLLIKQKDHLEKIVKERTAEILMQKEEIQTQAEELTMINEKLVELDHFKEGMTGMIVHDLKNPLNTILNISKEPETKQAGKQMLDMVMNILDIQKFESAQMKIEPADFLLNDCVFEALLQVKILYERKSILIENNIPKDIAVRGDFELIHRVFINLLTNAIKFTPNNGKISIQYESNPTGFKNLSGFMGISIIDSGQGIPPDKLNFVFDKFFQVEEIKSGGTRSTGLGLTFCKMAVEAHGGKIGVESALGQGSTFWFSLPEGKSQNLETQIQDQNIQPSDSFILSQDDKTYLSGFIKELIKFTVYEFSDVDHILKEIELKNKNIELWKTEVENALRACNEEKFNLLINL